ISRVVLDDVDNPSEPMEEILLTIEQEFNNHNGGDIAFGDDGYLYIGMGDGGSGGDPNDRGQDTHHMLGAFLRIDVDGVSHPSPGYNIPSDNPFADNPKCAPDTNALDCPEIYAWGIRNPWRWSFDGETGTLWAADVGQNAYEEVNVIERGGNYGWRCYEGEDEYNTSGCDESGYIEPVTTYPRDQGRSITGGYVYRGDAIPALQGRYVFGDYITGRIWALRDGADGFVNDELIDTSYNISSFALGEDGELYFSDYGNGRIRRIIAGDSEASDEVPLLLSETGCMDPEDITQPAEGLIGYDLNAPFWSDGAAKDRQFALPAGGTIDISADGAWSFPAGTIALKHFRLGGKLIETRLMIRHPDGVWAGYTYEWDEAQTDAWRVRGGKRKTIDGQDWIYPTEGQCMECHTAVAGYTLGLETAQLNRDFRYPQTELTANQLFTLDTVGVFAKPLADPPEDLLALPDPTDTALSLDDRARSYLHTNCAQCHQTSGPTPSSMDLRFTTAFGDTETCDTIPASGDLGITGGRIIAPGSATTSLLVNRMSRRDIHGMPRIGSTLPDADGVTLVSAWIDALGGCP
ncbi:MAG: PQQ-dependent sugar dehydrogenase, partial [Myxococcota bacterium]